MPFLCVVPTATGHHQPDKLCFLPSQILLRVVKKVVVCLSVSCQLLYVQDCDCEDWRQVNKEEEEEHIISRELG